MQRLVRNIFHHMRNYNPIARVSFTCVGSSFLILKIPKTGGITHRIILSREKRIPLYEYLL